MALNKKSFIELAKANAKASLNPSASAVLAYIAGKNSFPINYVYADVNKDGFVTKADAQIILNAYAHHTILK